MKQDNAIVPAARRLLFAHNLFRGARLFFEIFLNIFIWKLTNDISVVAWFNIIYLATHTISFHGFANIAKRGNVHVLRSLALFGLAVVYLVTFLLAENALRYIFPLAVGIGFFNGIYWISYHILRFDLTEQNNRGNYSGLEKGLKTFVDLVIPIFGGALISLNAFNFGYGSVFLAGSILFLVAFFVGNVRYSPKVSAHLHVKRSFSLMWEKTDIRKSIVAGLLGNVSRGGAIVTHILPIFIFSVTQDEFALGGWLSFFSLVVIACSYLFGKFVRYGNYMHWLLIAGGLYAVLFALLGAFPSFWMYILFGTLVQVISVPLYIVKRVISDNLIHTIDHYHDHRIEYIVVWEWFSIGIGRVASFVVLLGVIGLGDELLRYILFLMPLVVLADVLLIRSIKAKIV